MKKELKSLGAEQLKKVTGGDYFAQVTQPVYFPIIPITPVIPFIPNIPAHW